MAKPSHVIMFKNILGGLQSSPQIGRTRATMKKGSQQITNAPVIIANVLAAFLSLLASIDSLTNIIAGLLLAEPLAPSDLWLRKPFRLEDDRLSTLLLDPSSASSWSHPFRLAQASAHFSSREELSLPAPETSFCFTWLVVVTLEEPGLCLIRLLATWMTQKSLAKSERKVRLQSAYEYGETWKRHQLDRILHIWFTLILANTLKL